MTQVNLYEAKTHLSSLVDRAAAGEEIVIAKHGKARVRMIAVEEEKPRRFGANIAGVTFISDDFDEPDPEIIALFEGPDDETFD